MKVALLVTCLADTLFPEAPAPPAPPSITPDQALQAVTAAINGGPKWVTGEMMMAANDVYASQQSGQGNGDAACVQAKSNGISATFSC